MSFCNNSIDMEDYFDHLLSLFRSDRMQPCRSAERPRGPGEHGVGWKDGGGRVRPWSAVRLRALVAQVRLGEVDRQRRQLHWSGRRRR